jgi:hypothetical protein
MVDGTADTIVVVVCPICMIHVGLDTFRVPVETWGMVAIYGGTQARACYENQSVDLLQNSLQKMKFYD